MSEELDVYAEISGYLSHSAKVVRSRLATLRARTTPEAIRDIQALVENAELAADALKATRNNIIEECAKVCEWRDTDLDPEDTEYNPDAWGWNSKDYARNIRYLKSKT
mgnify:CR=1 FL=1